MLHVVQSPHRLMVNPLKTSLEYTLAGVYENCVLKRNQIVFNGLIVIYVLCKYWLDNHERK